MSLYHSNDPGNGDNHPPPREGANFPVDNWGNPKDRDDCPDCGKRFRPGDSKVTYTTQPFTSLPENKVSCPSCFKKISTAGVTNVQNIKHGVQGSLGKWHTKAEAQWYEDWRKRQHLRKKLGRRTYTDEDY